MSLFDLALEINRGQALRRAAKALAAGRLEDFQRAIKPGMPVDALLPVRLFPWLGRYINTPKTTLLLAASMLPDGILSDEDRHQAMASLLVAGADPFLAVPGDKRNTVDHLANRRDLAGWRLLASHGVLGDRICRQADAAKLDWVEAQDWVRRDLARTQQDDMETRTLRASSQRGLPRL